MIDQIIPNTSIRYSRLGKNAQYLHEISIDDVNGFQTLVDNLSRSQNLKVLTATYDPAIETQRSAELPVILPVTEITVIPTIPRPNLSYLNKVSEAVDNDSERKKELTKGIAIIVVLLTVITLIAIFK